MSEDLPYRKNVCLLIINDRNQVLVGERIRDPGHWQLPQGGMRDDADLENDQHAVEDALREAEEELGVSADCFDFVTILKHRHSYDFFEIPQYAVGRFRGQTQRFVVLRVRNSEIIFNPSGGDSPEFSAIRWIAPQDLELTVAERRREGYREPIKELLMFLNDEGN